MLKKISAVLLIMLLVAPLAAFDALKTDVSADGITWDYDSSTQVLTVSGTGAIPNYSHPQRTPCFDYKNEITKIIVGEGITSIGSYAFYGTAAKFVEISNTVTSIGNEAFYNNKNIYTLKIPGSVTSIGTEAFDGCTGIATLELNDGLVTIGKSAFNNCHSIKSITIPASVKTIGTYAFDGCYSSVVTFSDGQLETVGDYAFRQITNEKLVLPDSLKTIGADAFSNNKNLKELVTGANLTRFC